MTYIGKDCPLKVNDDKKVFWIIFLNPHQWDSLLPYLQAYLCSLLHNTAQCMCHSLWGFRDADVFLCTLFPSIFAPCGHKYPLRRIFWIRFWIILRLACNLALLFPPPDFCRPNSSWSPKKVYPLLRESHNFHRRPYLPCTYKLRSIHTAKKSAMKILFRLLRNNAPSELTGLNDAFQPGNAWTKP